MLSKKLSLSMLVGLLLSVTLLGCQSSGLSNNGFINPAVENEGWSASTPKPRLFQTITKYEWQLTHVTDKNGQTQPFSHKPPLIMEVRPEVLLFTEGCHRYQGSFGVWRPLPYPYSLPDMSDLPDDCKEASHSGSNLNKGSIQRALEIIFAPYSNSYFRFDPVLSDSPLFSLTASKQMALTTDKGKTFVFSGSPKPEQKILGLPITNELLERYQWHLVSALDSTNDPISELNHSNIPITANFRLDSHNQGVGFFTGCNGVGGSYALSSNQTLLIGISPSTLMGCGDLINGIENYLDRIMHNSSSQLTLSLQQESLDIQSDFPRYHLVQAMQTGETLIWQNSEKVTR